MSWTSRKKKEGICTFYFVRRKLFQHMRFIVIYSILNILSEYTYSYISKKKKKLLTPYTILLFVEIVESLQCILKSLQSCWFSWVKNIFQIISCFYHVKLDFLGLKFSIIKLYGAADTCQTLCLVLGNSTARFEYVLQR